MAPDEPSYRRRIPAGIVDSAFASLATFAVGLTAVTVLDDVSRGVYAVYFAAFLVGVVLPRQLVFAPASIEAVSLEPPDHRLGVVTQSLRFGLVPGLVGALGAPIAYAVTSGYADASVSLALAITCAVTIVLSPMQDFVRQALHIAARSWRAAAVSIVQFTIVVIAIVAGLALDVERAWIPFGALAVANAVSLSVAWVLGNLGLDVGSAPPLRLRAIMGKGVWLIQNDLAPSVAAFAVAAIIAALASPEDLGYAEAARVVAQPILVLSAGLSAVLSPRAMKAAMDDDLTTARQNRKVYLGMILVAAVGYIAVAGWDWVLNPMAYIVPAAYVVNGLVIATVIANFSISAVYLQIHELMGANREKALARIAWIASPVIVLGGATAGFTGAFALAISRVAGTSTRYALQARELGLVYGNDDASSTSVPREVA